MAINGTLSYPYIMASRQIQLLANCAFGSNHFSSEDKGFSFEVPEGYCILPNRLFPRDGSIEIVPKGWYFVFNEYAKGTVAQASQATLLFEPVQPDRDPSQIIGNLIDGRFASPTNIHPSTTQSGTDFTLVDKVKGTDAQRYNWAFTTHPDGKIFLGIVTKDSADNTIRSYIMDSISTQ